jgi:putative oxidoreductase
MFKKLWSTRPFATDVGLLLLRISVACLMLTHGLPKLLKYSEKSATFPDPLGVTPPISMALTICAEVFCSGFLLLGLFTRVALIPLMFTMLVAILIIHAKDNIGVKEHAISFLVPYLVLFLAGPGRYSMDSILKR